MLPFRRVGEQGPLLVLLHWLGGTAETWQAVSESLAARGVRCVALDLPGFGEAAATVGFDVPAMARAVMETVRKIREQMGGGPWFLAGHSMGGAVAAVVARSALDGEAGLDDLRGMVLVSASPPGPEPMDESKRRDLLESLGAGGHGAARERRSAEQFVDENTGALPLPARLREGAVEAVLARNPAAFRAWLEHGSREDWRGFVQELQLPTLVFAGEQDGALGPEAQRSHTLPHLPQGELVVLEGAGHLAPLERCGELVEHLTQFVAGTGVVLRAVSASGDRAFEELLNSDRTSPTTRRVMLERLARAQDWNHGPVVFDPAEFRTLRALAECVVPGAGFDLAACLDRQLAADAGEGWRFAVLPEARTAWHCGLLSLDSAAHRLHGVSFLGLGRAQQAELLERAAEGRLGRGLLGSMHLGEGAEAYAAEEMQRWFEDVRAAFTRLYMGDPRTMERIGYTGFADDLGFTQIQLGQQEECER